MKNLELELQKRLFIVERNFNPVKIEVINNVAGDESITLHLYRDEDTFVSYSIVGRGTLKFICKGSELTEEIAEDLVHGFDLSFYVDYNHHNPRAYVFSALDSFCSALKAEGYKWGENPRKKPVKNNYGYHDGINIFDSPAEWDEECYYEDLDKWNEIESFTFYPGKTLIFEIIS